MRLRLKIKMNKNLFLKLLGILLKAYLFIFLCFFIDANEEYTLTVQTSDGVIVVYGEKEALVNLKFVLKDLMGKKINREDVRKLIKDKNMQGIKQVEEFRLYKPVELLHSSGTKKELYTVRLAETEGVIPLIEGLTEKEAVNLLECLNFFPIRKDAFEGMDSLSIAKIIFEKKRKIIVYSNFNELETIYIIY